MQLFLPFSTLLTMNLEPLDSIVRTLIRAEYGKEINFFDISYPKFRLIDNHGC
ncbi:MAG: hypothetical protein ACI808_000967 [Paraglaciecola sp.]|jgi:hypothetical protein